MIFKDIPNANPPPTVDPTNWKRRGGVTKMAGQILVGTGLVVSAISLGGVGCYFRAVCADTGTVVATFFSTLEIGLIVSALGIMVRGVGMYLESMAVNA